MGHSPRDQERLGFDGFLVECQQFVTNIGQVWNR
jgi:hypothetical protein